MMNAKVGNYDPQYQQALQMQQMQQMQQLQMLSLQAGQQMLIPNQPQIPVVWAKPPPPIPGYPEGLEFLAGLDKILIEQEVTTGNILLAGGKNRYRILNGAGEQIYQAIENPNVDNSTLQNRFFVIQLLDQQNREVMRVIRDTQGCGCPWCICCCKSCAIEIKIEVSGGTYYGCNRQQASCTNSSLGVIDASENMHCNITVPKVWNPKGNVEFPILINFEKKDEAQIGSITKFFSGEIQEYLTKADNFALFVPPNLDIAVKALLLGGVFLIDFLYFESSPMHRGGGHGHRRRGRRGRH